MIHLITNTFKHRDPQRQAEYDEAMRLNLANKAIAVHAIGDLTDITEMREKQHAGSGITPGRLTFNDLFAIARRILSQPKRFDSKSDDVILIANADIYFDGSVELFEQIQAGECWACSRWQNGVLYGHPDSQDVWAFRGAPPVINADFYIGMHGCDNKLAYLLDQAGLRVMNPSLSIHCNHLHSSGIRVIDFVKFKVPPPYKTLPSCTIEQAIAARGSVAVA